LAEDVYETIRGDAMIRAIPILFIGLSLLVPAAGQSCQPYKVLVFTKTAGFNHAAQITAGVALIQALGASHGFIVDQTADATLFNTANLAQYAAVIFLNTTGDVLNAAEESAFQAYVASGGGYVGVHSATDTEYGWPFYGALVGTWFLSHPAVQQATVTVVDPTHPSTVTLPAVFTHVDEWYDFQTNVASNPLITVLLTVDESTYAGGSMGPVHPIAWCQNGAGLGRSWYTAMGHDLATYSATFFQDHLLGGIQFAAGSARWSTVCGGQAYGSSSGSPPLVLGGFMPTPSTVAIALSGGAPGATGLLAVGSCAASATGGGVTVLVDLAAPGFVGFLPVAFDVAGQWQLAIPVTFQLPGVFGALLHLQGAQVGPGLGASNGLQIALCQ
jgi:type 1 glutamine amidotransferase